MYRYQVWLQNKWEVSNASPEETVYSLDQALLRAKEISKTPVMAVSGSNAPWGLPGSPVTSLKYIPVFVIDCCQMPAKYRGVAYKGKWRDPVDNCKSCSNMSLNSDDCNFCGGASWSPYRK